MADQNVPQNPATPAPSAPVIPTDSTLKAVVKDLWGKYSIFFILVGAVLLVAKFGDIAMDILGWKSKKDVESATRTDAKLKAEENAANRQANELVKQAQELPKTEPIVSDDWFKRK